MMMYGERVPQEVEVIKFRGHDGLSVGYLGGGYAMVCILTLVVLTQLTQKCKFYWFIEQNSIFFSMHCNCKLSTHYV
jgi:hypothetical protein